MFPVLLFALALWFLHFIGWLVPIVFCLAVVMGIAIVYTTGVIAVIYLLELIHSSED